jgi:hypothetical protein
VITKCSLFQQNVALSVAPFRVRSSVSFAIFRQFVSALEGGAIEITSANLSGLSLLCEEFGFEELRSKLSSQQEMEDAEARVRIAALEEWAQRWDRDIAVFQAKFARLNAEVERLASQLRSGGAEVTRVRGDGSGLKAAVSTPSLRSAIISDFPAIFAEFRGKEFKLLWRGSRDGFGALSFHGRCDGHANTLTVILDTDGNVFGGFTPVEWESRVWNRKTGHRSNLSKADDSLKSFLFTLKNPHDVASRKFALKAAKKVRAILCDSQRGPCFHDIAVSDMCNANSDSCVDFNGFADSYNNDSRLDAGTVFTGSENFKVKEIEVFEITD